MTAVTIFLWDFHLPPKAETCAKFQLSSLLGSLARECDAQTDAQTHRHTDSRMPGENSANPGFASLVLGPELSNQPRELKFGTGFSFRG